MSDITRYLEGRTLILLSNREPYEHVRTAAGIEARQPAGGLVSALDPTMQRTDGVWVAWGSGSADREVTDGEGRLRVPPANPSYTLRRVWLSEQDIEGYYLGFANTALWPLCHMLIQHFEFQADQWTRYQAVNARFADALADEVRRASATRDPIVWIQDYHFALVAHMLREQCPTAFIHQFWHIPFPPADILRFLPINVYTALLRGLLGNDLIEFHTERYALNFLACVEQKLPEADVDVRARTVRYRGRTVHVGAYPISIDVEGWEALARAPRGEQLVRDLRARYAAAGCRQLGVSVDRVDYTKGIPERLRALDLVWTQHPELRGCFSFLLVATPSRTDLGPYQQLEQEVITLVKSINDRFATPEWTPLVLVNENVSSELLAGIYRAADLCLVSSLQDGMNLVAKEFVASQVDERGALLLSRFTGAAEEIDGALLINPFNIDGFAKWIRVALDMPAEERRTRMRAMRAHLHENTIFDWLEDILSRAATLMDEMRSGAP
jgi:trehalose 6-phosphate synthase